MAKPNTKVKADTYGFYVRAGGYIFRPQWHPLLMDPLVTTKEQRIMANHVTTASGFKEGDPVRARHIGGSMLGRVGVDGQEELWVCFGSYHDKQGKQINSEEAYRTQIELIETLAD